MSTWRCMQKTYRSGGACTHEACSTVCPRFVSLLCMTRHQSTKAWCGWVKTCILGKTCLYNKKKKVSYPTLPAPPWRHLAGKNPQKQKRGSVYSRDVRVFPNDRRKFVLLLPGCGSGGSHNWFCPITSSCSSGLWGALWKTGTTAIAAKSQGIR